MQPIPYGAGDTTDWQQIPIDPIQESLVVAEGFLPCDSAYGGVIRVRQSVLDRLLHAQALLPKDIELVVKDGYRSYEVQERLFTTHMAAIGATMPEMSSDELERYVSRYVSYPSTNPMAPSPHATGGVVDVILRKRGGDVLEFGSEFDAMSPHSALRFLEDTDPDSEVSGNRRLLYWAMTYAGFGAYAPEWWHFNAPETQMGARALGRRTARFGELH